MLEIILKKSLLVLQDSFSQIQDYYEAEGWADGLPVVPATEDLVLEMIQGADLPPEFELGVIQPSNKTVTVEKVAINSVMAGCLPEHFPIVLGAMRALFEHDPNCIHELSSVTNSTGVLILVNGPIRKTIDLNCTDNLLSPGNRANSTIARAIRLILINVFEQRPGLLDRG